MPLAPGTRLGPYEILTPLGAGGMGEVYRARDTRLNRVVAIKVSKDRFSDRFEREARSVAALNHPNICQIHDVGEDYLVMEYVEGQPVRSPDNTRKLLELAVQIADGVAAAHAAGLIHRDLKPDNILMTKDGSIKILDFGLAKQSPGNVIGDAAPTMFLTEPGAIVGTVAYMSPEQARGLTLDPRSDQFSLGVILYELATGRLPFLRASAAETMTAIIREEPAPFPAGVPAPFQWIVERCLAKEPGARYESTRDLYGDLKSVRDHLSEVMTPVTGGHPSRGRQVLLAAALLAFALFAGWWIRGRQQRSLPAGVLFQRITDFVGMEESPAIAPDGKSVAFVALNAGRRHIWVRLLAGGAPLQITHDDTEHLNPRWSPDSSSVVYYSPSATLGQQGIISEISALGGSPRRVTSALSGGDISHDGLRLAAFQLLAGHSELVVTARDGSGAKPIAALDYAHPYDEPRWSPDDRWIAFHRGVGNAFDESIGVVPSSGGAVQDIVGSESVRGLTWLPNGAGLVFASSSGSTTLYPPIFNLRSVQKDGRGERQLTFGDVSYVEPDMHGSGKLVASRIRMQSDIWKFPAVGSPAENTKDAIRITHQTGQVQTPSVSPDGSELVYLSDSGGHGNLWVVKADGSAVRQITFEQDPSVAIGVPAWSPRGDRIAFVLTRKGETGVWLVNPDGSGLRQIVPHGSTPCWSADGRWLYYAVWKKNEFCIEKVVDGAGTSSMVRCQNAAPSSLAADATLYYVNQLRSLNGGWDYEIRKAHPETAASQMLARLSGSRVPVDPALFQPVLSPDERMLAAPLTDASTSNLWAIQAENGLMHPLTDFGTRAILIARRVSWSPDSKYIYAAVAEMDADIISLDGLLR